MKSIANQYKDLKEGRMSQANFMRNLRMSMPQYITNTTSFNDAVRILKNKAILTEASYDPGLEYRGLAKDPGQSGGYMDDFDVTDELESAERNPSPYFNPGEEANLDGLMDFYNSLSDDEHDAIISQADTPDDMVWGYINAFLDKKPSSALSDEEFDDMIKRSEEEESGKYTKNYDDENALSETKEIKVNGKVVKNYKQNGDKSYDVEFEDGSKKQIYVSHDDWDNINNDNLEKKELNEARKKKEPKQPLHPNQIHPGELRMGIRVEMEHTGDPKKAEKIALDHLAENPYYYTALKLSGIESPSAPKAKAPVAAKKVKKKDATEMVDTANQMQKVKLMKESLEKLIREELRKF